MVGMLVFLNIKSDPGAPHRQKKKHFFMFASYKDVPNMYVC